MRNCTDRDAKATTSENPDPGPGFLFGPGGLLLHAGPDALQARAGGRTEMPKGLPTQKEFLAEAGGQEVIWVDPTRIDRHSGTKWPVAKTRLKKMRRILPVALVNLARPSLKNREPFFIPRDAFGRSKPIEVTAKYRKVEDFIENRDRVAQTLWYRELCDQLKADGRAMHKEIVMTSEDEIVAFLENYVGRLVDSLATEGFLPEHSGYESTAVIGSGGEITKSSSGNHRLSIARALGIDRFPLRIVGVHEDWPPARAIRGAYSTDKMIAALKGLEAES